MNTHKNKPKRNRISISLSDDEFERFKTVAQNEHLPVADYLKKLAKKDINLKKDHKKQSSEKLNNRLWLRMSDSEIKKLGESSKKEGVRKTTLAKDIILKTLNSNLFVTNDIVMELKQLTYLLSNMANNINQMAHYSNTIKRVVDDNQVLMAFLRIEETVKGFIEYKMNEGK